jgi:hypothetical protein
MPQDNEVDENAVAWVSPTSLRTLERDRQDSMWVMAERSDIDCCTEPLYSAATVAELRAEVERLSGLLEEGGRRLIDENMRASAAERRAGELEKALSACNALSAARFMKILELQS